MYKNVLYSRTAALYAESGWCAQLHGGNEQRVVAARLGFIISCAAAIIHRTTKPYTAEERKRARRSKWNPHPNWIETIPVVVQCTEVVA